MYVLLHVCTCLTFAQAMEAAAQQYAKRVNLLGRDIKKWKVLYINTTTVYTVHFY
jgi:hypothetical protein